MTSQNRYNYYDILSLEIIGTMVHVILMLFPSGQGEVSLLSPEIFLAAPLLCLSSAPTASCTRSRATGSSTAALTMGEMCG